MPHPAPQLKAPHLRSPRAIAHRLEWERRFERPATIEPSGVECPYWVPVGVVPAFVAHLAVRPASDRADGEEVSVPPIVERVEKNPDPLVLRQDGAVTAHLVHHPLGLGGRIPQSS